ncbi:hypothetical protein PUNSTDRAFT_145408 [Punctularia strigosozonata HHB-11173 SS5]|uniref:uncharacterized protein n=1 Tax=Punctularia strigosozonata (strain HHB-11173) TaxID=741275 RepID=UPI0004417D08|nr:uncharacterized protein PUNSTDRAFT_145408 [Punctularia strigosozonata HHB-11173 SS5]EIN06032.1 hypothetical protein PUNSTDRAFT_145408 [Punctularia strigosozonata HHB-11173 SS5]
MRVTRLIVPLQLNPEELSVPTIECVRPESTLRTYSRKDRGVPGQYEKTRELSHPSSQASGSVIRTPSRGPSPDVLLSAPPETDEGVGSYDTTDDPLDAFCDDKEDARLRDHGTSSRPTSPPASTSTLDLAAPDLDDWDSPLQSSPPRPVPTDSINRPIPSRSPSLDPLRLTSAEPVNHAAAPYSPPNPEAETIDAAIQELPSSALPSSPLSQLSNSPRSSASRASSRSRSPSQNRGSVEIDLSVDAADSGEGQAPRWTFRKRQPIQKRPVTILDGRYAKQMKAADPDAYVPPRYTRGRSRSRERVGSGNGADDSQDKEWQEGETQEGQEEGDGEGFDDYVDVVRDRTRRGRRSASRARSGDRLENEHADQQPSNAKKWYPKAFDEMSDDDVDGAQSRGRTQKSQSDSQVVEPIRRKKSNAFPMRLPITTNSSRKTVSPRSRKRRETSSRARSRTATKPAHPPHVSHDHMETFDVDVNDPHHTVDDDMPWEIVTDADRLAATPPPSTPPDFQAAALPTVDARSIPNSVDSPVPASPGGDSNSDSPQQSPVRGTASSSGSEDGVELDPKQQKILKKMGPVVLWKRMVLEDKSRPKNLRKIRDKHRDESGPLQPGQSRVRPTVANADREVRGDTESEDDERSSGEVSPRLRSTPGPVSSPRMSGGHKRLTRTRAPSPSPRTEVIDLPNDDSESSEEGGISDVVADVDDELVATFNDPRAWQESGSRGRVNEGSLIDYMLTRTLTGKRSRRISKARSHSKRRRDPGSHGHARRSYPLDIVVGGARSSGGTHQTRLPFRTAGGRDRLADRQSSSRPLSVEPEEGDTDGSVAGSTDAPNVHKAVLAETQQKRKKKNRGHRQMHLHVQKSDGRPLIGLRRRPDAVTIDLEDESFHIALAPLQREEARARARRPAQSLGRDGMNVRNQHAAAVDHDDNHAAPHRRSSSPERSFGGTTTISLDFGIKLFRPGLRFSRRFYLGREGLYSLVAALGGQEEKDAVVLPSDVNIVPSSSAELCTWFSSYCTALLANVNDATQDEDDVLDRRLHEVARYVSNFLSTDASVNASEAKASVVHEAIQLVAALDRSIPGTLSYDHHIAGRYLSIHWFAVEVTARLSWKHGAGNDAAIAEGPFGSLLSLICSLCRRLQECGVQRSVDALAKVDKDLDHPSPQVRGAELWICLFHLSIACRDRLPGLSNTSDHPLFDILRQPQSCPLLQSDLEASETLWRSIFSLSALSQFSAHGMARSDPSMPPSWDVVLLALKQIRLTHEAADEGLSRAALRKRDEYVRLVVFRCFLLCKTWKWSLHGAVPVITHLMEIFKSRRFCNLQGERSDFPVFIREHNIKMLFEYDQHDTAFSCFLKLIFRAAQDFKSDKVSGAPSAKLRKVLSLVIPVGSVPFTKSNPPLQRDLSMLFNRICTVFLGILLEPSPVFIHHRFGLAQGYADFRHADFATRHACIRGAMYFTILFRHLNLPLNQPMAWAKDMAHILLEEYRTSPVVHAPKLAANHEKDRIATLIQILLMSLQKAVEVCTMDPNENKVVYPDPALLDGPWISETLNPTVGLVDLRSTGYAVRSLVQAFLDARSAYMPKPRRPRKTHHSEDSQEYDDFELDLNDPALLVALGEAPAERSDAVIKEARLCQIIDSHIMTPIFRFVCKHVLDPNENLWTLEQFRNDADHWVDCWVGCANVLVQNGLKDWSRFYEYGSGSWDQIMDTAKRRRVSLRFMYTLLRLDPQAYTKDTTRFMQVMAESLVTATVSFEHKYVALLLSIDDLEHPLLRGLSVTRANGQEDFDFTVPQFLATRCMILECMFKNLEANLPRQISADVRLARHNQEYMNIVAAALSTMKDIETSLPPEDTLVKESYGRFRHSIMESLTRHPAVAAAPRLRPIIESFRIS